MRSVSTFSSVVSEAWMSWRWSPMIVWRSSVSESSTATMSKAMMGSEETFSPPSQVSVTESCSVLSVSVVDDELVLLAVEDDAQSSRLGTINSISVLLRTRGVTTLGSRILLSPNDEHAMTTCTPARKFSPMRRMVEPPRAETVRRETESSERGKWPCSAHASETGP